MREFILRLIYDEAFICGDFVKGDISKLFSLRCPMIKFFPQDVKWNEWRYFFGAGSKMHLNTALYNDVSPSMSKAAYIYSACCLFSILCTSFFGIVGASCSILADASFNNQNRIKSILYVCAFALFGLAALGIIGGHMASTKYADLIGAEKMVFNYYKRLIVTSDLDRFDQESELLSAFFKDHHCQQRLITAYNESAKTYKFKECSIKNFGRFWRETLNPTLIKFADKHDNKQQVNSMNSSQ